MQRSLRFLNLAGSRGEKGNGVEAQETVAAPLWMLVHPEPDKTLTRAVSGRKRSPV